MRPLRSRIRPALLALGLCCPALAAADQIELTLELANGTSDHPMIVAWAATADGGFVRTLHWFSKDRKYMKDLTSWAKGHDANEGADPLDGVIGPTIRWNTTQTVSIPVHLGGIDLLDGSYVLRIEQRKDKAGHYKSVKIPLGRGFTTATLQDAGYLKTLTVVAK